MSNKEKYNWLPDFVYGGIDGVVTTFAVVAGVTGASLSISIILVLGFANLFADGFSMAVGKYSSDRAVLQHKGNDDSIRPLLGGFYTFVSFNLVGVVPLLGYIVGPYFGLEGESTFLPAVIATLMALFFIGVVKGKIVKMNKLLAGLETMLIGGLAALIAYYVGYFLKDLM